MILTISHQFVLPVLFCAGFLAGTVDAIAGGGGLISLPVLLGIGIPPHLALGTNKLQSTFGTTMAAYSYYRHGWIDKKKIITGIIFSFMGAAIGAIVIQFLSGNLLEKLIPLILAGIFLYTVFSPHFGHSDQDAKMNETVFYVLFGLIFGFYDGFLGPGVGSLWVFSIMFFLGYNLLKATAYTKIFNLNTNIVALVCFAIGHHVNYEYGLLMAVGQLLGGKLGAYLAIRKGTRFIRPFFLLMISATIATLIYRM